MQNLPCVMSNVKTASDIASASSLPVARMRVVCIALLGVVPLTLFVQWSDMVVGGTMVAGPFPPLAACIEWGLLFGVNALLARIGRREPLLTRPELLVVLAVWLAANMVAGRGMLHPLLTSLVGSAYYARGGAVTTALGQNVPDWLAVKDKAAVSHFFEGYGVAVPWQFWLRPLAAWSLFLLPFLVANVCLCALFERVWVQNERLAFPLVALPLEALRPASSAADGLLLRQMVAFGMAFPLLLHGFGVAHAYLPDIPCVPFFNDVSTLVSAPPWTSLRPLYVNLYPLLIGLTFLAPTDVTFSVWFFLVLNKAEQLMAATAGWNDGAAGGVRAMPPYIEEQSAGAFLVLAALLVWNARGHLRHIAFPGRSRGREAVKEAAETGGGTSRVFLVGFLGGTGGVLAWCVATGLPFWFSVLFFGFYFAVALVLSRLMAEGGVTWILAPILPDKLILSLTGTGALAPVALTRLTLHVQHLRDTRQMLAPALFQTGKIRDATGFPQGRFYLLLLTAVVLALIVGTPAALTQFYRHGALSLSPNSDGLMMTANVVPTTAVGQLSSRLLSPIQPTPGSAFGLLIGMGVTLALSLARIRFPGWPLHPLGYALTGTLQVGYANKMLFSIFLGWACKTLILRFGGSRGFRLMRGVALGLILGDLLMGGLLKLLDALLGPGGYAIF